MLFHEGGRARQGVRCCGGCWGNSRRASRNARVTRRRVLTSIPVDLHIQEQLILFNTPAERESEKKKNTGASVGIVYWQKTQLDTTAGPHHRLNTVQCEAGYVRAREKHVLST